MGWPFARRNKMRILITTTKRVRERDVKVDYSAMFKSMYEKINTQYLTKESITLETVDKLIERIVQIDVLYYENILKDEYKSNPHFFNKFYWAGIHNRIIESDVKTAATIDTVLSILTGVYKFTCWWKEGMPPQRLFNDYNYATLSLIHVYHFDPELKDMWVINDGDLLDTLTYFLSLTDEEIEAKMLESLNEE